MKPIVIAMMVVATLIPVLQHKCSTHNSSKKKTRQPATPAEKKAVNEYLLHGLTQRFLLF